MIKKQQLNQDGFAHVILLLGAVLLVVGLGIFGFTRLKDNQAKAPSDSKEKSTSIIWQQTENGWQSTETAPECPKQPMLKMPSDGSEVTSVLYPGQTRGGNYKPHGGFRFDESENNEITVKAPLDGYIVRGASYIAENEVQYTFDAMNNCGVMFRVGHLRELPDNLQKIADKWPRPSSSSATQPVVPAVYIRQGDVLATKVGIINNQNGNNVFYDMGVYDYRQENQASRSATYQSVHSAEKELAWHAVCWLEDWLPQDDEKLLASLPPGDPSSKTSLTEYSNTCILIRSKLKNKQVSNKKRITYV